MKHFVLCLVVLALVFSAVEQVRATQITINFYDSGWYNLSGYHNPAHQSYIISAGIGGQWHDFFVFDLSGFTDVITGAELRLWNPSPNGYQSTDPTQIIRFYDVSTPIASLIAGGSGKVATYNDLGSGTVFGSKTVSTADCGTIVSNTLNTAAIADLNASIGAAAWFRLAGPRRLWLVSAKKVMNYNSYI